MARRAPARETIFCECAGPLASLPARLPVVSASGNTLGDRTGITGRDVPSDAVGFHDSTEFRPRGTDRQDSRAACERAVQLARHEILVDPGVEGNEVQIGRAK